MDIPTGPLTADNIRDRVNRMVKLQRRWSGWMDVQLPQQKLHHSELPTSSWRHKGSSTPEVSQGRPTSTIPHLRSGPAQASEADNSRSSVNTRPLSAMSRPATVRPSSATRSQQKHPSRTSPCRDDGEILCDSDVRWSHFGLAVDEVASLKSLCDSIHQIAPASCEPTSSTSTAGAMSVELAFAALEATTRILQDHPLLGFLLQLWSQWLPRGVYSNPFPLLAEAAALPTDVLPPSSPSAPAISTAWSSWLIERSHQWSRLCIPLGTVTSVFDAARSKCLADAASGQQRLESLGAKLFGSSIELGGDSTTAPALARHEAAYSSSREAVLTLPLHEQRRMLRSHLLAWREVTIKNRRFHICLKVCTRTARKSIVETAFFKWKCETMVALAERKSGHSARLHFVVEDNMRRLQAQEIDMRNLKRERDGALNQLDKLLNDSKLAINRARDVENGMVFDFRKPIYPAHRRRGDPLTSGYIYFERQPQAPLIGSMSGRALESSTTSERREHPTQFSYDCGRELLIDGVALPCSENFRSCYKIQVEGTIAVPDAPQSSKQTVVDPLLSWANDEVLAVCSALTTTSGSTSLASSPAQGTAKTHHKQKERQVVKTFAVSELGEVGQIFERYVKEWQEKIVSWQDQADELKLSSDPVENICVLSSGASSRKPAVVLGCNVRKASDLRLYPYLYALLVYRVCPFVFTSYCQSPEGNSSAEELLVRFLQTSPSMGDVFPLLARCGVTQHIALEALFQPAAATATAYDGLGGQPSSQFLLVCDASHRVLLSRLRCYQLLRTEYEPFWKLSVDGVPLNRSLTLVDMILPRGGPLHSTEVVASEVLEWVRSTLRDPLFDFPAESESAAAALGTQVDVQQTSLLSRYAFASATQASKINANRFLNVDNFAESFGEGLELLWILVERLTPINFPPMGSTSTYSPSTSLRQRNAARDTLGASSLTAADESPCEAAASEETLAASITKTHSHPLAQYDFSSLPIETVARVLCNTARDMFGCQVPDVLFEQLHFATPSLKCMFVTVLYASLHRNLPELTSGPATESSSPAAPAGLQKARSTKALTAPKAEAASSDTKQRLQLSGVSFPCAHATLSLSMLQTKYSLPESAAQDVLTALARANEAMFLCFLKYFVLSASASRDVVGLPFVAIEMLSRDLMCGFQSVLSSTVATSYSSPEDIAALSTAVRKSFLETKRLTLEELSAASPIADASSRVALGAQLLRSDSVILITEFAEWLVAFCAMAPETMFSLIAKTLRKHQHKRLSVATEETSSSSSVLHRVSVVLDALHVCLSESKASAVGAEFKSESLGGKKDSGMSNRDLCSSLLVDIHLLRAVCVHPQVFRDRARMAVPLFVRYSNWRAEERWHVLEERRMTKSLFMDLCSTACIVAARSSIGSASFSPTGSASTTAGVAGDPLRDAAVRRSALLGWSASISGSSSYSHVSPLRALIASSDTAVKEDVVHKLSAPKGSATVARFAKKAKSKRLDAADVLKFPVSRGCRADLLSAVSESIASLTFDVVSLSRQSTAATAIDKALSQAKNAMPTQSEATTGSFGQLESTAASVHALSYAGFCEVIAHLAQQCVSTPFLTPQVKTALLLEFMFAAVFVEDDDL